MIARPNIQRLDELRYDEARKLQRRHDRIVFLAERIDTLEIFVAHLARGRNEDDDHVQYIAASDTGQASETRRRARQDIIGAGPAGFTSIRQGHLIEEFFRAGARRRRTSARRSSLPTRWPRGSISRVSMRSCCSG